MRHTLYLAEQDDDGTSRRDVLELSGAEIQEPEVWYAGQHLLDMFWRLDETRGSSGFGLLPVSPHSLLAWCQLMGYTLEPWEASLLLSMDFARRLGPEEVVVQAISRSDAINPGMFDAMFPGMDESVDYVR